jgi:hypothetical protein
MWVHGYPDLSLSEVLLCDTHRVESKNRTTLTRSGVASIHASWPLSSDLSSSGAVSFYAINAVGI